MRGGREEGSGHVVRIERIAFLVDFRYYFTSVSLVFRRFPCSFRKEYYNEVILQLIGDYMLDRNLLVHVDGARLAYAAATIRRLELEAECLIWSPPEGIVRWMCSWDTTEEDVDDLIRLIEKDMN